MLLLGAAKIQAISLDQVSYLSRWEVGKGAIEANKNHLSLSFSKPAIVIFQPPK